MLRNRLPGGLLILGLAVALSALAGDGRPAAAVGAAGAAHDVAQAPAAGTVVVEALDDFFRDAVIRVPPGTTVVWEVTGRNPHTVTADDGSWDSGHLNPGDVYRRRFDEPGRYPYYCVYHGAPGGVGMAGVVIVGEDAAAAEGRGDGEEQGLPPPPDRPAGSYVTRRVPDEYPTIQAAVDAAAPGDLILIAPGVYREEVVVTTPHLTIRGLDRNRVIIDGEFQRANGIKVLGADGVVIENMTARNHTLNGFYWTGVLGYRGSYLTAYNNGDYGIYAYDSVYGQFDHSYASGSPDSGIYIGQCKPCHAVITDVIAEHNALGYSGTNAGGNLTIMNSIWRHNMAGIVPNTLDSEKLAPQDGTRIVNNLIYSNHDENAPAKALQYPSFGNGIVLAGGINNVIEGNLIWDHPNYGILIVPNLDEQLWIASGHTVRRNTVWASGRADLALAAPAGGGTCFQGNRFETSSPGGIEWVYGCGSPLLPLGGGDPRPLLATLRLFLAAQRGDFPQNDWRDQPVPSPQPDMPDPQAAPRPAWPTPESRALPGTPDRAPAEPPAEAAGLAALPPERRSPAADAAGAAGFLAPPLLYAGLALWTARDLLRRPIGWPRRAGWLAAAILLPYLGALVYALAARRSRRSPPAHRF